MNEKLLSLILEMLYFTDEQPFYHEIKKSDLKKHGWWKKYHWTEKNEQFFIRLMTEKLKKQWQGIVPTKPGTRKLRIEIAEDFVANYGPVVRKLTEKDFMPIVSFSQLDEVMSKREREEFNKWMFGQTTSLYGVYQSDLFRWLNIQNNYDKKGFNKN